MDDAALHMKGTFEGI